MQNQHTPHPSRKQPPVIVPVIVAILIVVGLALAAGFVTRKPHRQASINAADGDPAMVTPVPSPTVHAISLKLDVPAALSDRQLKYEREVTILPRYPQFFGLLDKHPLALTDNDLAVFGGLIASESGFDPYDQYGNLKTSSAGCRGIAQLCLPLPTSCGDVTPDVIESDELSIYYAACFFQDLLQQYQGDYSTAIARYKGALHDGVITEPDQVGLAWSYVRVKG